MDLMGSSSRSNSLGLIINICDYTKDCLLVGRLESCSPIFHCLCDCAYKTSYRPLDLIPLTNPKTIIIDSLTDHHHHLLMLPINIDPLITCKYFEPSFKILLLLSLQETHLLT